MQETHHSEPVHVHLPARILHGIELQRTAYAHAGVVDEHVDAPFGVGDLLHRGLDLRVVGDFGMDIDHAGNMLHLAAAGAVDLVALAGEPLGHGLAEAGGYASYQDYHFSGDFMRSHRLP